MKVASSLTDIIGSGHAYQGTPNGSESQPLGLSLEELAMVHGGSGGKSLGWGAVADAAAEFLFEAAEKLSGPTLDEAGTRLRDWVFSEDPVPPPPQPAAYQEPAMSGEANMSMEGGGVGQEGVPVDDAGQHHYVWLPPEVNMSSAEGGDVHAY